MVGTVTVNVSGKLEINFDFSVSFSSNSDEVRSILRPINCPVNLALTEISDSGNGQLDLSNDTNDEIDRSEGFESSTTRPPEEMNSSPSTGSISPTDLFPSLSALDTDWLSTSSERFEENWLDSPVGANVFGPRVVASIANAFNEILTDLNSDANNDGDGNGAGNDDDDGNGAGNDDDDGNAVKNEGVNGDVTEIDNGDGDVVFLFEVVRT